MLLQVFSVYDSGVHIWKSPIFSRSQREVLGLFVEAVNTPTTEFAKHPTDFTLFRLGTWDDSTCKFDLLITPISVRKAIECVKGGLDKDQATTI